MDVDQQFSPQAGDPDRGRQMIDGRGGEDGEPDRLEARRFLEAKARERAIELDCLQKGEPMGGERGQGRRDHPSAWLEPAQRPDPRGNRRAIGSQFIIGLRGEADCMGGTGSVERVNRDQRDFTEAAAPCFSIQERISGPAASKNARDQRSALARSRWYPSLVLSPSRFSGVTSCKPSALGDRLGVADLCFGIGNVGQDNTFPLSKLFQEI